MKHFSSIALALIFTLSASAQQMPQLPIDPAVKTGVLENGMTYYIRHNDKPADRAEFYLATHVGAVQEAPDQDGLAHFLEHMCFNGTKNFPGKSLLNYLEGIGASFGGNINAATGFEQTTYMLNNIPLVREGVLDTCLLIMHDYSHFVTCDPAEIDAERGVIMEEKRTRNTASWRNNVGLRKYLMKGSPLAQTTLIGTFEQLESFQPESLTSFYHTWYRPDLQALIVVGDVDVDAVEAKIISTFADIPAVENPQPKVPNVIPDNEAPIIGIVTDPENNGTSVRLVWKSPAMPDEMNNTMMGVLMDACKYLISNAMNERLSEIAARPGAPYLAAGFGFSSVCEGTDGVMAVANVRDAEALAGVQAVLTELRRMSLYGFSDQEIERGKANLSSYLESYAAKADTRKNSEFIDGILEHFFHNATLLDPKDELELYKQVLSMINTKALGQIAQQLITDQNMVLVYTAPEKEGLEHPSEADFLSVIGAVNAMEIAPLEQEDVQSEFLNPSKLKGAKKVSERSGLHSETVWTLSNGLEVVLVPSELEKDRISLDLALEGGRSLLPLQDLASVEDDIWSLYVANSGVGKFSNTQVSKMLSGTNVSVSPYLSGISHGIAASSTPKDLEKALQLMYLYFTSPRFDADEYNKGIQQIEAILPNLLTNAEYKFQNTLYGTLYGNHPRRVFLDMETLENASLKTLKKDYTRLFHDVAGAKLYICGDFQPAEIEALVLKYAGSLPKGKKPVRYIDHNIDFVSGNVVCHSAEKMEQSKVRVVQVYNVPQQEYSYEKQLACQALSYILDMVYVETLRESEGGTYGASTVATIRREPKTVAICQVVFDTNLESMDKLIALAKQGLEDLAKNGPSAVQFDKTIKNFEKNLPESRIRNSYWEDVAQNWIRYGEDSDALKEAALSALTPEMIQAVAAEFVGSGNYIEVVLEPELQ